MMARKIGLVPGRQLRTPVTPLVAYTALTLATLSLPGRAQECDGGSCAVPGIGGGGGGSSVSAGVALTGSSVQSLERDWRTRLLLDNLSRGDFDEQDATGGMTPIIGQPDPAAGELQLTGFSSYQQSQYAPFSGERDAKDTEFSAQFAVDGKYGLSDETQLTGNLTLRKEWSEDDPEAFPTYDINLLRLDGGAKHYFTDEFSAKLKFGTAIVEGAGQGLPPDGAPDPEFLMTAELEYADGGQSIRGGFSRDAFGSPDAEGYKLANLEVIYADANARVHDHVNLNLRGGHIEFSDDNEDYDAVTGICTFYPSLKTQFGLSLGATQEFRDENETIWVGGVQWMGMLSERNSMLTNTRYHANTSTDEREITSELIFGRTTSDRRHGGAIGVSMQYEYEVDNRYSAMLFIRLY